jgi:acetyltransferase-like isoleucine patch superfamily enzyme
MLEPTGWTPFDHGIPENPYNAHCWITGQPQIGAGTWIGAFTLIDGQGGLSIGRDCDISSGAQILTHSTVRRCLTARKYARVDRRATVLEDHVFVGTRAVILMGSHIGHHSIIGAGAVVLEGTRIPPYSLVVGVPARVVRDIREEVAGWEAQEGGDPCQRLAS